MNARKFDLVMTGEIVAETDISVNPPYHSEGDGPAKVMTLPQRTSGAVARSSQPSIFRRAPSAARCATAPPAPSPPGGPRGRSA